MSVEGVFTHFHLALSHIGPTGRAVDTRQSLKHWLDEVASKVLPDGELGDAVSCNLNQRDYLTHPPEDGAMSINDNLRERDIRIFATGRKSWPVSATVGGINASAIVYSLMLTCHACGVEPLTWLRQALIELPQCAEDANIDNLPQPPESHSGLVRLHAFPS